MKDRKLQVAIIGVLMVFFVGLIITLPDNFYNFNLQVFKIGFAISTLIMIIALAILALSQTKNIKDEENKFIKVYEKIYHFAINVFVSLLILGVSINISLYISPIIKNVISNLDLDSYILFISFSIFFGIIFYLNKKGIKLLKNE